MLNLAKSSCWEGVGWSGAGAGAGAGAGGCWFLLKLTDIMAGSMAVQSEYEAVVLLL